MSQISAVSVVETDDGDRHIRLGEVDQSGKNMELPTPNNDVKSISVLEWELSRLVRRAHP